MKILSLELSLYKRLSLKRINYIKITPESKIQLILGTNGSGKSSVLKEMTPLPAIKAEYHEGGFKVIEISHKNKHYVLKSIFHPTGAKYHFIEDGVDLLSEDGGNSLVYKQKVKEIFNLTADSHELTSGNIRFSEMDGPKRRMYLTRFSDADYSYAISYYGRLKKQLTGTNEAIKVFQKRLMQESEKLLKPEEEAKYREDIRVLNETLAHFLELKTPVEKSYDEMIKDIEGTDVFIENLTKVLLRNRQMYFRREESFTSMQDLDNENIKVQADLQTLQYQIDTLFKTIDQQQKTLESLRSTNVESLEKIDKKIDGIGPQIYLEERKVTHHELKWEDPSAAYQAAISIGPDLNEILINIGKNEGKAINRNSYITSVDDSNKIRVLIDSHTGNIREKQLRLKELDHLKTHDELTCPKCDHKWHRGYSEKEYLQTEQDIKILDKQLQDASEQLRRHDLYQEEAKLYLDRYRSYMLVTQATKVLDPFWQMLLESDMIFENPRYIMTMFENLKSDLQAKIKVQALSKELKANLELKLLVSNNQAVNASKLISEAKVNEDEMLVLNRCLQERRLRSQQLTSAKKILLQIEEDKNRLQQYLDMRDNKVGKLTDLLRRKFLDECITAVRKELNDREQIISRISIQKALVEDIKEQIIQLETVSHVLDLAARELSPSEGLIAKGLIGFINHYTAQMNLFIKNVWMYPMEILPIVPSDDDDIDLDYKFEVKINDDYTVPDIAKVSSGQKEIIDLAFRVVSMPYEGQSEAPLHLDEFAKTFDEAHRRAAFDMIVNIANASNFSQIFMVSHYDEIHGNLANTDVTVMCDKNLTLSKGSLFNRHVVMN